MRGKVDVRNLLEKSTEIAKLEGPWKYILPFTIYIFIGEIIKPLLPGLMDQEIYIGYLLRTVIVGALLYSIRGRFPELKTRFEFFDLATLITGIAIFLIWIGLEGRYPAMTGPDQHYDPTVFSAYIGGFLIFLRLIGSVIVAPLMEELFTRSFFMRYIIDPDWEKVPIGTYTLPSFILITLFFGFSHYRWLPGLITAALLNLLLYRKKSLTPCITAHATANLLLLGYVVTTGSWYYY